MKKIAFLLSGLLFINAITGTNPAYSFSITKAINSFELMKYAKGSEYIKLSFKQFSKFTGKKETLWNKLSFSIMKMKIKHDLKKNPELNLMDYNKSQHRMSMVMKILAWIIGIALILLLVVAIIFSGQKR